jgi:hypothetical protein
MARPAFKPTADQQDHAKYLARFGVSERDIASTIGVDRKTLRKHFAAEIAAARVASRIEILKGIRTRADLGHLQSAQFLLRLLGGATEKKQSSPPLAGAGPAGAEPEKE